MLTTILVPLDGSELAARALPFASRIARATGAQLLLVRATVDFDNSKVSRAELWQATHARERIDHSVAAEELAEIAEQIRVDGLAVSTFVRPGPAAATILEAARTHRAGLIVMSTHGRGGLNRWLYGSVTDQILRHTTLPILLVPPGCEAAWPDGGPYRILIPLDGSWISEEVVEPADQLAALLNAEVTLIRAVGPGTATQGDPVLRVRFGFDLERREAREYLKRVAARLRSSGRPVTVLASVGNPGPVIAATVRKLGIDLIAMATHGRGGLARLVMGSIATETLRQTTVPVLLIRPANLVDAGGDLSDHNQAFVGPAALPSGYAASPPHHPASAGDASRPERTCD